MTIANQDLIESARLFIGRTKWQHQGRYVSEDLCVLDCAGLAIATVERLGIKTFDKDSYFRYPTDDNELQRLIESQCDRSLDYKHGCLMLFKIRKQPQHLAWLARDREYDTLIHAIEDKGVEEVNFDSRWRERAIAAYRVRGVDYTCF